MHKNHTLIKIIGILAFLVLIALLFMIVLLGQGSTHGITGVIG